jgi:hypothetical protein
MKRIAVASLAMLLSTTGIAVGPVGAAVEPRVAVADAVTGAQAWPQAPDSQLIEVRVILEPNNNDQLQTFLTEVQTPGSQRFHRFLQTGEFARTYGATPQAVQQVRQYFQKFGLNTSALSANHLMIRVSGSVGAMSRALGSRLHQRQARVVLGHAATLPASTGHYIRGIVGLSTLAPARSLARPLAQSHALPGSCSSANSLSAAGNGYTVAQQAQLYGLTAAWASGAIGTGQQIAVYELAPYRSTDLTSYFTCYGLSPTISTVNVDGGTSGTPSSEPTLDIEELAALAPGAQLAVYQGPNNATGPTDVFARIASDNTASVVSVSWGICEAQSDAVAEATIFQQMAAQGQTVLAASGDSGSSDCYDGSAGSQGLAVDDPASQPTVTGVGGTLVSSISPFIESVWNDGSGATGGGFSLSQDGPAWQAAATANYSSTMRAVPDLSVMGDPQRGFIMYFNRGWSVVGGTSIGSPIVSALVATANTQCGGGRLGTINERIYGVAAQGSGFRDVTTGDNDLYGVGAYNATTGYDPASGLGSPDPSSFLSLLCPPIASPTNSVVATPDTATPIDSAGATITVSLHDQSDAVMTSTVISVALTQTNATPVVVGTIPATDVQGFSRFVVRTNQVGTVTAVVSAGDVTLDTVTISFVPGVRTTDVTNDLAGFSTTRAVRTANDGAQVAIVGNSTTGEIAVIHSDGSGRRTLASAGSAFGALTTPDISCTLTCVVAYNRAGHIIVVQQIWSSTFKRTDLQVARTTLPKSTDTVRVLNLSSTRTLVSYISTIKHLMLVTIDNASRIVTVVDKGVVKAIAPTALGLVNGRPRILATTSGGYTLYALQTNGTWSGTLVARNSALDSPGVFLADSAIYAGHAAPSSLVVSTARVTTATIGSSTGSTFQIRGSSQELLTVQSGIATVWIRNSTWRTLPLSVVASLPAGTTQILGSGSAVVLRCGTRLVLIGS